MGSIAFRLIVTNGVYLLYLGNTDIFHKNSFSITVGGSAVETLPDDYKVFSVTYGMVILWTIGSGSHSLFDLIIWHAIACGCCRRRCFRSIGVYSAVIVVIILVAVSSFVLLVRAAHEVRIEEMLRRKEELSLQQKLAIIDDDKIDIQAPFAFMEWEADFGFIRAYAIEVATSLLVYSPIIQTLLFTGIFGCGHIPYLGGRPYELRKERQQQRKEKTAMFEI